jgi:hypothetical protein
MIFVGNAKGWLGAYGVNIKNSIPLRVEFESPVCFKEATGNLYTLINFVDLVIGKPQALMSISVDLDSNSDFPDRLDLYSSMQEDYNSAYRTKNIHQHEVLINGGLDPEGFAKILASWIERQDSWKNSRWRFIRSFREQNEYSIDRLIGAANMFDLLPEDAVGIRDKTSIEMIDAVKECKSIFKKLPKSPEKDNILSALGRIGKHSLKTKAKHRAKIINDSCDVFPDLNVVIDECINCRNFFVHGAEGKLSPEQCYKLSGFFTDTLEFVFGASDLIESGWNINEWFSSPSFGNHPFAQYRHEYHVKVNELKSLLA